jgi:hypothetical protein
MLIVYFPDSFPKAHSSPVAFEPEAAVNIPQAPDRRFD